MWKTVYSKTLLKRSCTSALAAYVAHGAKVQCKDAGLAGTCFEQTPTQCSTRAIEFARSCRIMLCLEVHGLEMRWRPLICRVNTAALGVEDAPLMRKRCQALCWESRFVQEKASFEAGYGSISKLSCKQQVAVSE